MIRRIDRRFIGAMLAVAVLVSPFHLLNAQQATYHLGPEVRTEMKAFQAAHPKLALGLSELYLEYQAFLRSRA